MTHSVRILLLSRKNYPVFVSLDRSNPGFFSSNLATCSCSLTPTETCCKDQIQSASTRVSSLTSTCPFTWDGFACFRDTSAGSIAQVACPTYIYSRDTTAVGTKACMANGSWWRSSVNGKEWTDYSLCVNIDGYRALYYAGVSLNVVSLVCLLPACFIFLSFKQLLKQHRIRIHLNLFLSFILTNGSWLCWDTMVYRDRLENMQDDTAFMYTEPEEKEKEEEYEENEKYVELDGVRDGANEEDDERKKEEQKGSESKRVNEEDKER
ncbi:calcitonin gene-related peptide type 1 receptor-like [Plakobranchus ocellatus]|uniref:Calcitonin gene-related peptide type 1 receptor-like n=1 Tax=Plakobranchus ocellatus TaxID=259542 RepID=A0AAV4DZQ4_9GAST|nr:calcitonin gene-related peptide type 1 receptor-like [Plakobranchus ocellatus]